MYNPFWVNYYTMMTYWFLSQDAKCFSSMKGLSVPTSWPPWSIHSAICFCSWSFFHCLFDLCPLLSVAMWLSSVISTHLASSFSKLFSLFYFCLFMHFEIHHANFSPIPPPRSHDIIFFRIALDLHTCLRRDFIFSRVSIPIHEHLTFLYWFKSLFLHQICM